MNKIKHQKLFAQKATTVDAEVSGFFLPINLTVSSSTFQFLQEFCPWFQVQRARQTRAERRTKYHISKTQHRSSSNNCGWLG